MDQRARLKSDSIRSAPNRISKGLVWGSRRCRHAAKACGFRHPILRCGLTSHLDRHHMSVRSNFRWMHPKSTGPPTAESRQSHRASKVPGQPHPTGQHGAIVPVALHLAPTPTIRDPVRCSSTNLTSGWCRSSHHAPKEKTCLEPRRPHAPAFRRVQHHWTLAPKCQSEISICLDTRWLFGCCGRHEPKEPGWQHPSQLHAKSVLPAPRPSLCGPKNRMWRRMPRDRLPGCFRHGSAAPALPRPKCRCAPTVPLDGRGRHPSSPPGGSTVPEPCATSSRKAAEQ